MADTDRTPPDPYTDRTGDRIQVGTRFPPAMHARLTDSAEAYGISINQLLIELVDRALHHTDTKASKNNPGDQP